MGRWWIDDLFCKRTGKAARQQCGKPATAATKSTAKNPDETQFVSDWSESSLHSFDEGE
jgi:hypothetical protein